MDPPSYQLGHRRAASTSRATGALSPHTHGELRAREKLQANAEAIVDAWLRNHAPPESAFRLPPSVTFHIETPARNVPGTAISAVSSGPALPESAGASSAHFVEPPAQDQVASDDAVTPGAAGLDAADPVSHDSRDFLYFPAPEASAVTPSAIRPHPEHRRSPPDRDAAAPPPFPHSGFPPSPAHVEALLTTCAETSLPDSDDETAEDETAALTRKRARESYGSDAGAPRKQPLRAISSPNSSSCEESVLDSGADSGETDIVPSSVAGTASQRDHEKSDFDLEAPHYPEGPFHETENTPPHPPAPAGATTMEEDGDTGTADCGAPVSTETGGSCPPAIAFLRDPAPSGTAPAKRQQKRRKNTKASRRQRPSVQPRPSPPPRPHTVTSLNSVPPGASAVPGSLVDAQPAASTPADPQETGGEFQLVRSRAAIRRERALAAVPPPAVPPIIGTALFHPSAPGGSFRDSPRLEIAAYLIFLLMLALLRSVLTKNATSWQQTQRRAIAWTGSCPRSCGGYRCGRGSLLTVQRAPASCTALTTPYLGPLVSAIRSDVPVVTASREGRTVRVLFDGPVPPEHVHIYNMRFPVRRARPRLLQCQQCGRFGHVPATCDWPSGVAAHTRRVPAAVPYPAALTAVAGTLPTLLTALSGKRKCECRLLWPRLPPTSPARLPKQLSGRSGLSPAEGPEPPRPMRARCVAPAPPRITPHRHQLPASSSQVQLWEGMVFTLEDPRYGLVLPPKGLLRCLVQLLGWRQSILTRTS
ncbi:hypothetical protein HPB50_029387 [Hyalomma asiaticum]|nr:hypothetical protein HPB50_029387 [Hyalomma asiaticum]